MRRKLVVAVITVLGMLAVATAAYAALNTYAGSSLSFSRGVGTKAKPVGVRRIETLQVKNTDPTKAAAVLTRETFKIYGLASNANQFPTCSPTKMVQLKSDKFCPAKSKFASGLVHTLLGDPTLSLANRTKCNPNLDVFNGGKHKLIFFFTTSSALQCAGLTTGAVAPYFGTVKSVGKFEVIDIKLPADISTRVENQPNLYGSLIGQRVTYYKVSTKVKGKTVYNSVSVGCQKGSRPWSITFTATSNGRDKEVHTVKGTSPC